MTYLEDSVVHTGWTMDPETSRDLDDALRFEELEAGGYRAHIYVAAPGLTLHAESPVFKTALRRRATQYLANDRTRSMLPVEMEQAYSLLPGEERDALYICAQISAQGVLDHDSIDVSQVRFCSRERYTYADAHTRSEDFVAERAFALSRILERRRRGSVSFVDLEEGVYTDEQGHVHKLVKREEVMGHIIVQEAMILGNEALATWCAARGVRIVFRTHVGPEFDGAEERERMTQFINEAIEKQDKSSLALLESTLANKLTSATYSTVPDPHWALQLPMYTHGTSPLRRVYDLITQMHIFAYLEQRPLTLSWHELERTLQRLCTAQQAQDYREIERYKQRDDTLFLEQLLGDEELSSKQMRRAIRFILEHPEKDYVRDDVLKRIKKSLEEAREHPANTAPVALLDVMLESTWSDAYDLARGFLDEHDSGWKQQRAHAIAKYDEASWWATYRLPHDPVVKREREEARERHEREQEEALEREAKQRKKRRFADPLAQYNDLKMQGEVAGELSFSSTQEEGKNYWEGQLITTHQATGQTNTVQATGGSKKGVKRELISQAVAWWRAHFDQAEPTETELSE